MCTADSHVAVSDLGPHGSWRREGIATRGPTPLEVHPLPKLRLLRLVKIHVGQDSVQTDAGHKLLHSLSSVCHEYVEIRLASFRRLLIK